MQDRDRRITELDGIRGLAALGVVIYHYHRHFHASPLDAVLFPLYRGGNYLVDLFFILSGFILAQVYAKEARYSSFGSALKSRLARLYPLHLFTLLLVAPLQKIHVLLSNHCFFYTQNDWWHLTLNLLLLNESGLQTGFSFNGPSWSISTEFIVNILFLAIALGSALRAHRLGLALVFFFLAFDLAVMRPEPPHALMPFVRLFRCFMTFGMGLLLHAAHERLSKRVSPGRIGETLLIGFSAFAVLLMAFPSHPITFYGLCLVCFPVLVLLSIGSRWPGKLLRSQPLVVLGQISYALYLLHFPMELLLRDIELATGITLPYASPLFFAGYLAMVGLASFFTYRLLEVPSRRWLRQWGGFRPQPVLATEVKH